MDTKQALKLIYRHTHRDSRGTLSDCKTILVYRNGTCLVPLEALTAAEIAERLPLAERREAERLEKIAAKKAAK